MQCAITFRVTAPLAAGERVHVMGDSPSLGSWGVANSLALTTTTDSYPLWFSSRPVLLPAGAPVHYKYCVVADGRLVRSEAIEGSRYMVPQGREAMVEDKMDLQPPTLTSRSAHQHASSAALAPGGAPGRVAAPTYSHHEIADDEMFGLTLGPSPKPQPDPAQHPTPPPASGPNAHASDATSAPGGAAATALRIPDQPLHAGPQPSADGMVAAGSGSGSSKPPVLVAPGAADAASGSVGRAHASAASGANGVAASGGGGNGPLPSPGLAGGRTNLPPSATAHNGGGGNSSTGANGPVSSVGTAGSQAKETLTDADGVLVVQYRLPVKMRKVPLQPDVGSGSQPGTPRALDQQAQPPHTPTHSVGRQTSSNAPPTPSSSSSSAAAAAGCGYRWEVSWDVEALLSPKLGGSSHHHHSHHHHNHHGSSGHHNHGNSSTSSNGSSGQQHASSSSSTAAKVAAAAKSLATSGIASVRIKWIGTPPVHVGAEDEDAVTRALEPFSCIPVFLPERVESAYYDGYCRDTLWPIFHNVIDVYGELPTRWWIRERQADRWKSYCDGNQRFAAAVVENFHEGDLVWIHDYPLLLVPMILARRHIAPISIFLHIPFPSSEVFRTLSVRDELLRGMLSADAIGFHLFEYARHFLTSCRRILGLTHSAKRGGILAVDYQGREVQVSISHVGIEPEFLRGQFTAKQQQQVHNNVNHSNSSGSSGSAIPYSFGGHETASQLPPPQLLAPLRSTAGAAGAAISTSIPCSTDSIVAAAAAWRARFPGCAIIGALDSIERLRGVPLKLASYEGFLADHPAWRGRVTLVQVCTEEVVRPGDTQETSLREIAELAQRINEAYTPACAGCPPAVHLVLSRYLPLRDRLALWAASDVYLNTAIRDGLNLTPFEYTFSRGSGECIPAGVDALLAEHNQQQQEEGDMAEGGSGSATGATVATLAGATTPAELEELRCLPAGALILSEFSGASRVLSGALRVNPFRQEEVTSALAHALGMSPDEQEARSASNLQYVLGNTTTAWAERILVDLKRVSQRATSRTYMGYGLGLGYRLMGFGSSFRPLNTEHVVTAYRKSGHRLIVVDYGGTLNTRENSLIKRHAFEMGLLGKDAAPPLTAEIRRALKVLSEDWRNTVFVISGKEKDVLQAAFAGLPHVGLSAEHGFYYRWGAPVLPPGASGRKGGGGRSAGGFGASPKPVLMGAAASGTSTPRLASASASQQPAGGASNNAGDNGMPWESLTGGGVSDEWKQLGLGIMETYAARTNGTYILRKGSAISWHYGDADPEFGGMQAKELQDHLAGVLASYPVDVLSGHDYVEVRPKGVNKGVVLALIMDYLEGRDRYARGQLLTSGGGGGGAGAGSGAAAGGGDRDETAASSAAAAAAKRSGGGVPNASAAAAAISTPGLRMTPRISFTPSALSAPVTAAAIPPLTLVPPATAVASASGASSGARTPQLQQQQAPAPLPKASGEVLGSGFNLGQQAVSAAAGPGPSATQPPPPLRITASASAASLPPSAAATGTAAAAAGTSLLTDVMTSPLVQPAAVSPGTAGASTSASGPAFQPRPLEFILCIGDDLADEEMFTTVQAYRKERIAERRALVAKVTAAMAAGGSSSTQQQQPPPASPAASAVSSSATSTTASASAGAGGRPPLAVPSSSTAAAATASGAPHARRRSTINTGYYYDGGGGGGGPDGDDGGNNLILPSPGVPVAAPRVSKFGVGHLLNSGGEHDDHDPSPMTGITVGGDVTVSSAAAAGGAGGGIAGGSRQGSSGLRAPNGGASGDVTADGSSGGAASGHTQSKLPSSSSSSGQLRPSHIPSLPPFVYYEYTVTVGKKPSAAQYYLDDTQQTEDVMRSMAKASLRPRGGGAAGASTLGPGVGGSRSLQPATAAASTGAGAQLAYHQQQQHQVFGAGGRGLRPGAAAAGMSMPALLGTAAGADGSHLRVDVGPAAAMLPPPSASSSYVAFPPSSSSSSSGAAAAGGDGSLRPGISTAVKPVPGPARTAPQARAGVPGALANLYASTTGLSSLLALSTLVQQTGGGSRGLPHAKARTATGNLPLSGSGGALSGDEGGPLTSAGSGDGLPAAVTSAGSNSGVASSSPNGPAGSAGRVANVGGGAVTSPSRRRSTGRGGSASGGHIGGSSGDDAHWHDDDDLHEEDEGEEEEDEDGDGLEELDQEGDDSDSLLGGSEDDHHHHHVAVGGTVVSPSSSAAATAGLGRSPLGSAGTRPRASPVGSAGNATGAGLPGSVSAAGFPPVPSPTAAAAAAASISAAAGSTLFSGYAPSLASYASTNVPMTSMSSAQLVQLAAAAAAQQQQQQQQQHRGGIPPAPATTGPISTTGRFFPVVMGAGGGGGGGPAGSVTFSMSMPALTSLVPAAPSLGPPILSGGGSGGMRVASVGAPPTGTTAAAGGGMPLLVRSPSAGGLQDYLRGITENDEEADVMF